MKIVAKIILKERLNKCYYQYAFDSTVRPAISQQKYLWQLQDLPVEKHDSVSLRDLEATDPRQRHPSWLPLEFSPHCYHLSLL